MGKQASESRINGLLPLGLGLGIDNLFTYHLCDFMERTSLFDRHNYVGQPLEAAITASSAALIFGGMYIGAMILRDSARRQESRKAALGNLYKI